MREKKKREKKSKIVCNLKKNKTYGREENEKKIKLRNNEEKLRENEKKKKKKKLREEKKNLRNTEIIK
jgi:hypothetical protein